MFVSCFLAHLQDHSGSVSYAEFRQGMKKLTPLTDNEVHAVIQLLDQDGDGEIDIGEFMAFIKGGNNA